MSCHEPYLPRKRCDDGPVCVQGPPGPPGLPCDMDWGAVVMQYIRTAVVGIATREGDLLGRGFWVSSTVVATAWSLVNRESAGVRVIIDVPSPLLGSNAYQALPIDGVVVYAVPLLDVAFIVVNPLLLSNWRYTPRVLGLEGTARAGDRVATTYASGSFATGFVCNASVGTYGYISDVTTSLVPCVATLVGAPIIHAYTYGIVGMVQYVNPYDVTSGGINAVLLATALSWAASSCVLRRPIAQGAVTIPVLRDALALGTLMNTSVLGGGIQVAVPLVTEAVRPQLLSFPLGETATGAWVFRPTMNVDDVYGTADSLGFGGNTVTYNSVPTLVAMDANYVRSNATGTPYESILAPDTILSTDTSDSIKVYTSSSVSDIIRVSVDPASPENHLATDIWVSVLGIIVFATAEFPVTLDDMSLESLGDLIANPNSVYRKKLLYAAPFACASFGKLQSGGGFPVTVSLLTTATHYVVQWDTKSDTLDPVSFQVSVRYVTALDADSRPSGEVTFQYACMPGAWACSPWLTGTSLTSNPEKRTLELIRVDTMPSPGDLIYFGTASYDNTVYVPGFKRVAHIGGTYCLTAACPARRTETSDVRGTVVVLQSDGTCFFKAVTYTWPGFDFPVRVARVDALPVGDLGVDNVALSTVIASIAPRATEALPVPVTVRVTEVVQTPGTPIGDDALVSLLQSVTVFGTSSRTKGVLTSNKSVLFDVSYEDAAVYNSLLMTLPALANAYGTYSENNFTAASMTITVPIPGTGVLGAGDYLLFVAQLASTNSTSFDTQFSTTPTDDTCIIIYGNGSDGYRYVLRNGYGGTKRLVIPTPISVVGSALTVNVTLSYSPSVVQRVNALVVGRPPRAGNAPLLNDPIPLPASAVLVSGSVTLNAEKTKTAPMASVTSVDTSAAYVITSQHGIERPFP